MQVFDTNKHSEVIRTYDINIVYVDGLATYKGY